MLDFTVAGWKDIEIDEDGEYGCRIFGRRILLRPKFEGELDISKGE
jgi:hypothetical protein